MTDNKKEMEQAFSLAKEKTILLHKAEKEIFGFDHAKLGGLLLKHWKLPQSLYESIANHHMAHAVKLYETDTAIIHIADLIANSLQLGSSGEKLIPKLLPNCWEMLNISVDNMKEILQVVYDQYNDAVNFIISN